MQDQEKSLRSLPRRTTITVEIMGETYQLAANGDPQYVIKLANEVNARMRGISLANPHLGPMKVAILTMLELTAEIKKVERAIERQEQNVSARCLEMERELEVLLGVA